MFLYLDVIVSSVCVTVRVCVFYWVLFSAVTFFVFKTFRTSFHPSFSVILSAFLSLSLSFTHVHARAHTHTCPRVHR